MVLFVVIYGHASLHVFISFETNFLTFVKHHRIPKETFADKQMFYMMAHLPTHLLPTGREHRVRADRYMILRNLLQSLTTASPVQAQKSYT